MCQVIDNKKLADVDQSEGRTTTVSYITRYQWVKLS